MKPSPSIAARSTKKFSFSSNSSFRFVALQIFKKAVLTEITRRQSCLLSNNETTIMFDFQQRDDNHVCFPTRPQSCLLSNNETTIMFAFQQRDDNHVCFSTTRRQSCLLSNNETTIMFAFQQQDHNHVCFPTTRRQSCLLSNNAEKFVSRGHYLNFQCSTLQWIKIYTYLHSHLFYLVSCTGCYLN